MRSGSRTQVSRIQDNLLLPAAFGPGLVRDYGTRLNQELSFNVFYLVEWFYRLFVSFSADFALNLLTNSEYADLWI